MHISLVRASQVHNAGVVTKEMCKRHSHVTIHGSKKWSKTGVPITGHGVNRLQNLKMFDVTAHRCVPCIIRQNQLPLLCLKYQFQIRQGMFLEDILFTSASYKSQQRQSARPTSLLFAILPSKRQKYLNLFGTLPKQRYLKGPKTSQPRRPNHLPPSLYCPQNYSNEPIPASSKRL